MSDINNDDYLLYTLFRKGTSDDPYIEKSEEQQIHNCIVRLSEIPQKQYRVSITSSDNSLWYEIDDGIPESNQYKVDYNTGKIQFSSDNEAKTFTFNYLSVGQILINSERVKISLDQGLNVEETLQQLIDQNRIEGNLAHRKQPVNTYNDIATTYPLPVKGDMVQTLDTNKMWIWTGQDWYWFYSFPTQQVMDLQNNVTDIYDKIGDLSQLPTNDKTSLVNSNKELSEQLAEETQQRLNQINEVIYVKKNKPQYRGVAYGLLEGNTDIDDLIANVKKWDCQIELVVFISVSDINSTNFATLSTAKMNEFFQKANTEGVNISFMAIHLVQNFNDGSGGNKGKIKPLSGSENEWFTNYEQSVRFYMEYAKDNGVNYFSIANENISISADPNLLPYWIAMINSLKSTYPTIQLSYNSMDSEQIIFIAAQKAESDNLLNHLDFISVNVYPRLSENAIYTAGDESLNKILKSITLLSTRDTIHALSILFDKEIFISETGCMGLENSLYSPIYLNQDTDPKPINNLVQGCYYNGIFNSLALIDAVKGLFIWNYSPPFDFIGKTAETIFEDYMKGE